jgi:hypothetical protein
LSGNHGDCDEVNFPKLVVTLTEMLQKQFVNSVNVDHPYSAFGTDAGKPFLQD